MDPLRRLLRRLVVSGTPDAEGGCEAFTRRCGREGLGAAAMGRSLEMAKVSVLVPCMGVS